MRARLHAQRQALEHLLSSIEREQNLAKRALLTRKLRHFSFIEQTPLVLADERALAQRYRNAVDATLSDATSDDAVSALFTSVAHTLAPTASFSDPSLRASYQQLAQQLKNARIISESDREALATITQRYARTLLNSVAQRARALSGMRRDDHAHANHSDVVVRAYATNLLRIEQRLQTIIAVARDLHEKPPLFESGTTLIVSARDNRSVDTLEQSLAHYGAVTRFKHIPYFALTTDDQTADDVLSKAAALGRDARIYRERLYSVNPLPAAPLSDEAWNLELVKAPQAWEVTRGAGASVAIIDTGIDYEHKDLAARFTNVIGEDFTQSRGPADDHGHGTHVAGTVAGAKTGVAPEATLYAVKVLDASGYGTETAVLQGMEWAIDKKVEVINMSLGSTRPSSAERALVAVIAQRGISLACAAGNSGESEYNYPASYEGATSVAAVTREKRRAPFSTYNDQVDLAAPGVAILSCMPGDHYDALSGTSMASPHVAGAYALLASRGVSGAEKALMTSAENLGTHDEYGAGLINCAQALTVTKTAQRRTL